MHGHQFPVASNIIKLFIRGTGQSLGTSSALPSIVLNLPFAIPMNEVDAYFYASILIGYIWCACNTLPLLQALS